jgi:predicted transcriptional regulator of viral defense system
MTADVRATRLAASQGGVISRAQAQACELTTRMIDYRVSSGRWQRVHQGVYAVAGLPPSWLTAVWAAILAAGDQAVVSHETALLLHGLPDRLVPRQPVSVTARHGVHAHVAGAVVHQCRELPPCHAVRHRSGLMVTTPARRRSPVAPGRRPPGQAGSSCPRRRAG